MLKAIKILLRIIFLFLILALGFVFLLAVKDDKLAYKLKSRIQNVSEEKKEPITFQQPEERVFNWSYDGKDYSIKLTLYRSAYEYYKKQPKVYRYQKGKLPANWKDEYFSLFIRPAEGDFTFSELAGKIREAGAKYHFSEDQVLELALAFVQAIPYDDERAGFILSQVGPSNESQAPKYPYELLYENKGVCSEKSFLAFLLARELGYGAALMEYEEAKHMSVGIQCPAAYSTENTGYCYAETTTPGHRVGIVPQLSESGGKALQRKEISYFQESENPFPSGISLKNPDLYQEVEGKVYREIINIVRIQQEINNLEKYFPAKRAELEKLEAKIDSLEAELLSLRKKMDKLRENEKYEEYNKLVSQYNSLVDSYKGEVKKYNDQVKEYNQKVNYYNKLIKDFSI